MLKVDFTIVGISPYSQSKVIEEPKKTGETPDAYEERTWPLHMHTDAEGNCYIPGGSIKACLSECAKFLSESVPGKGKATYTKHFDAGVLVLDHLSLGIKAKDVKPVRLHLNADGKKGGGKRVWRKYPEIPEWRASGSLYVIDPVLADKPEVVEKYLKHAGSFIGLGRFRPRNGGTNGRFKLESFSATKVDA